MSKKTSTINYNLIIGTLIIGSLFLMMFISLFWTPYPPNAMDTANTLAAPSLDHWLGTDNFGRDILSRIMEGSKTAFEVSSLAILIGLVGGVSLGSLAGYIGGNTDEVIMRMTDAMIAIPGILFSMMLISIFDAGKWNTILALGVPRIPTFARLTRGGFMQIKTLNYVTSSQVKGASDWHVIRHHILPNTQAQIIVALALSFSTTVLSEAGLSYLGLGITPPDPSWGSMLSEAQPYFVQAPWYIFSVGIFVTLLVFGFNLLGDGLRRQQDKRAI